MVTFKVKDSWSNGHKARDRKDDPGWYTPNCHLNLERKKVVCIYICVEFLWKDVYGNKIPFLKMQEFRNITPVTPSRINYWRWCFRCNVAQWNHLEILYKSPFPGHTPHSLSQVLCCLHWVTGIFKILSLRISATKRVKHHTNGKVSVVPIEL